MKFEHISLTPASPAVGAFVDGVQLSDQLSDATLAELRLAHAIHGVLFFRDQTLTPEQHIDFAEQIGEINVNRFFTAVADHPKIAEVRKEPEQTTNIGGGWEVLERLRSRHGGRFAPAPPLRRMADQNLRFHQGAP